MEVKQAYNLWADQYDSNNNKTRDLEALALRKFLSDLRFNYCLEVGCGTGKNTGFLSQRAKQVMAVDLSEEMLEIARKKIVEENVHFIQSDIHAEWNFSSGFFDLVTFSLVLEHIENLDQIFKKVSEITSSGAWVYIGELHPFKQYSGTKARFDFNSERQIVTCFDHHISDFTLAAVQNGFQIVKVNEYFDNDDRSTIPRILALLFRKST